MQCKLSMDLEFFISEEKFSLDFFVVKLAELYEKKAFAQIIRLVLMLVQEVLVLRLIRGKGEKCSCGSGHWQLNGDFKRRIRTRLGAVELSFKRIQCSCCRTTFAPMQKLLKLGRYQTKTNELEKLVVENVSTLSYRKGVAVLCGNGGPSIPYHTAHDWMMKTDCDEIVLPEETLKEPLQILPDGTGFKGSPAEGKAARGDLKVVIGVTREGTLVPMGSWAGRSWSEIHEEWQRNKVKFAEGSIVICDGELGLAENFVGYADEVQRCQWHINRDLYHMMHHDGASAKEVRPVQKRLAGVMAIELPEDDFQKVNDEDKAALWKRMSSAEHEVLQLIAELEGRGYAAAATYLRRAREGMFGYVRRWLKWGLVSPKASSMVERTMRAIAQRIKKIAYGWKEKGVSKIARIILKRFANEKEWEAHWKSLFGDDLSVIILFKNLKVVSQNFAH